MRDSPITHGRTQGIFVNIRLPKEEAQKRKNSSPIQTVNQLSRDLAIMDDEDEMKRQKEIVDMANLESGADFASMKKIHDGYRES